MFLPAFCQRYPTCRKVGQSGMAQNHFHFFAYSELFMFFVSGCVFSVNEYDEQGRWLIHQEGSAALLPASKQK